MKLFSLLLPTRGRKDYVIKLFDSIIETSFSPKNIEVILYIDEDDKESCDISHLVLSITKITGPRTTMGDMTAACYAASQGHYIFLMNDDVIFHTKNWDIAVLTAFSQFKDDIGMVYGNNLFQKEKIATFPVLSRTVCDFLENMRLSEYLGTFIDVHIHDIFSRLQKLGYHRIIYLSDVIFEHRHFLNRKSEADPTYTDRNPHAGIDTFINSGNKREFYARKLAEYIETQQIIHHVNNLK